MQSKLMPMLSHSITVCVFAFNEEARLGRCLENFASLFEILVVDNFSADRTREVAERAGVRVVSVRNPGFIETPTVMDKVFAHVSTPYVLLASVSEYVPLALLKKYAAIADARTHDVVRAYRMSVTAGKRIPISGRPGMGNAGTISLFRPGSVDFAGNEVHGRGVVKCDPSRELSLAHEPKLYFYQFRDYDSAKTERVLANYDDVLAKQWYERGKKFSLLLALADGTRHFLASYLRNGSWRYGMLGFIHSYYRFHMAFTTWLRLWEWREGYDMEKVRALNDAARRKMEDADTAEYGVVRS